MGRADGPGRVWLIAMLGVLVSAGARADTIAVQSFSDFLVGTNANFTIGWSFDVSTNIQVTALGVWDATPFTPLAESHAVGLWTGDGTQLLASVVVQPGSTLLSGFRYESVAPVALTVGSYRIGAHFPSEADTWAFCSPVCTLPTTTAAEISFGSPAFIGGASLTAPEDGGNAHFGPNFQFVPEPSTGMLIAAGFALFSIARRPGSTRASARRKKNGASCVT